MSKSRKIAATCPNCKSPLVVEIKDSDLGKDKQGICPKCHSKMNYTIPMSFASLFESDLTIGGNEVEQSLVLETVPDALTAYQSFNLTSDYYTIGRKNNGTADHRSDIEVETADTTMSRKHAAIRKVGKVGFTVRDIGSKNGLFLKGRRLEAGDEFYLSDGDILVLGETKMRVSIVEGAGAVS